MECRDLYIEIELGDPPKVFYFYTDTGSGSPWVLCDIPNSDHVSTVPDIVSASLLPRVCNLVDVVRGPCADVGLSTVLISFINVQFSCLVTEDLPVIVPGDLLLKGMSL